MASYLTNLGQVPLLQALELSLTLDSYLFNFWDYGQLPLVGATRCQASQYYTLLVDASKLLLLVL